MELIISIKKFFSKLIVRVFCQHEDEKEIYTHISGWCDLNYWYKCKKCGRDRIL